MNGYNFTERMRRTLAMAREEAARLHHEYVGTEHLLLGLLREGGGVAAEVLARLAVDTAKLISRVEQVVVRGKTASTPGPDLPYTSRAKTVLELAMTEARNLNHSYVGTEHLLLGLIAEQKGIAAQLLIEAGLTLDAAHTEVLHVLGTDTPTQWLHPHSAQELPATAKLGDLRGKPLARIDVTLRYQDGRAFETSFTGVLDAIAFLASAAPRAP